MKRCSWMRQGGYARPVVGALVALAAAVAPTLARADYKLMRGDTVEITVIGIPDLKWQGAVDVDGFLNFPLAGRVRAAGVSVNDLSARVRLSFANRAIQQRSADGHAYSTILSAGDVNIDIVAYAPVYLLGDVASPGQQQFHPGMTVRQAMAVAGGSGLKHTPGFSPKAEASKLNSDLTAAWVDYVRSQATIWRINAEVADTPLPAPPTFDKALLKPDTVAKIVQDEAEHFSQRHDESVHELSSLKEIIAQSEKRLGILDEQLKEEQESARLDNADFEQAKQAFAKGITSVMRLSDSRRTSLLSSTRALQTSSAQAEVRKEREDYLLRLAQFTPHRQAEEMKDLQDNQALSLKASAQIKAIGQQLQYIGASQQDDDDMTLSVTLFRGGQRIGLNDDNALNASLLPGDTVEIHKAKPVLSR